MNFLKNYFKSLYFRTMNEAYSLASDNIITSLKEGGNCLDCGANTGYWFEKLASEIGLTKERYYGIEWNEECVREAQKKHINIQQGDLNKKLPFENDQFSCIFGLSVLEHLLNSCHFLRESYRLLKPGGTLVILTPNISTYFTAILILTGRMPSTGPHPDSNILMKSEEIMKVSASELEWDTESNNPVHRHLVVYSFSVLKKYLNMLGFSQINGYGFGLYPLPIDTAL
jgi:ubiquinone/menaquinone biosynthesis C-methylase UbiE